MSKWTLWLFTKTANVTLHFKSRKLALDCSQQIMKMIVDKKEEPNFIIRFEDDFGGVFAFSVGNLTAYKIEEYDGKLDRVRELEIKRLEELTRGNSWRKNEDDE